MTNQPAADLVKIFRLVKTRFNFTRDCGMKDWQMPPADYDGKQTISNDCDGFRLACRKLLRERGIPNRLVYCEVEERGRTQGHLVVEVSGWILDNRQGSVIANTGLSLRYPQNISRRITAFPAGPADWLDVKDRMLRLLAGVFSPCQIPIRVRCYFEVHASGLLLGSLAVGLRSARSAR